MAILAILQDWRTPETFFDPKASFYQVFVKIAASVSGKSKNTPKIAK